MITNQKVFVALIAILSMNLSIKSANAIDITTFCKSSDEMDAKCGAYAYRIVKPMMEYFAKINKEIELKDKKIVELENKTVTEDLGSNTKMKKEFGKLIQSVIELKTEIKKLKESLNQKETENSILRTNLNGLQNNLYEKNNEIAKCELSNSDNNKKIADFEKQQEENSKALSLSEKQISELNENSKKCKNELVNLEKVNAILENKLALKNTNVDTEQALKSCEKSLLDLSNKMSSTVDSLTININNLTDKNRKLEKELDDCDSSSSFL